MVELPVQRGTRRRSSIFGGPGNDSVIPNAVDVWKGPHNRTLTYTNFNDETTANIYFQHDTLYSGLVGFHNDYEIQRDRSKVCHVGKQSELHLGALRLQDIPQARHRGALRDQPR